MRPVTAQSTETDIDILDLPRPSAQRQSILQTAQVPMRKRLAQISTDNLGGAEPLAPRFGAAEDVGLSPLTPGAKGLSIDPLNALKRGAGALHQPASEGSSSSSESDEEDDAHASKMRGRREAIRRQSIFTAPISSAGTAAVAAQAQAAVLAPKLLLEVRKERAATERMVGQVARKTEKVRGLRSRLAMGLAAQRASTLGSGLASLVRTEEGENERDGSQELTAAPEMRMVSSQVLGRLKLKTSKQRRLDRLRKLTTLCWSSRLKNAYGMQEKDRQRYEEVFKRYDYNRSGGLDLVECYDALADLGLKPMDRQEKLKLKHAVEAEDGELDFSQFCKLAHERQTQINDAERQQLMQLFQQYDTDHSGALSAEELLEVFTDLHLSPERDDERIAFLDAVVESDIDGSGEIEWAEFEILVHIVRQKISQCRREREVRICQQMRLPPHIFLNFRHMLITLHDGFRAFDKNGQGTVCAEDVPDLILELGFDKNLKSIQEKIDNDEVLSKLLEDHELVDFAVLMQIAQRLREINDGTMVEDLRRIFDMYDLDNNGTISEGEILKLMRDLGLEEWRDINEVTRLIDECDTDGNGVIDFDEFQLLFKTVSELQQRQQREMERQYSEGLGFDDAELRELREIFAMLDTEQANCLSFPEVTRALDLLGHSLGGEEALLLYDTEKLGRLDFKSFLQVMRDAVPRDERGALTPGGKKSLAKRMSLAVEHIRGSIS